MPNSHQQTLTDYYDANTRRFLAWGGSGRCVAIHRGLWDDTVANAEAAARRIHDHLLTQYAALQRPPPQRVLDLGCGVGGTLLHLAPVWPDAKLCGITLSTQQAHIAEQLARENGHVGRLQVLCGDFLQTQLPQADLLIAIESHVHAPSLPDFLAAAAQSLAPDGVLILVDDFLRHPEAQLPPSQQRLIERFRRGWRLGHLSTLSALDRAAANEGLEVVKQMDYSASIKLDRRRDRVLRWLAPGLAAAGAERWPICANMIGGDALTQAYRQGLMQYALVILRRSLSYTPTL